MLKNVNMASRSSVAVSRRCTRRLRVPALSIAYRSYSSNSGDNSSKRRNYGSVDPSEAAKFSNVSWWRWSSSAAALRDMNVCRSSIIVDYMNRKGFSPRSSSCLDVGCGGGILSESLAEMGFASVRGIDLSPSSVEQARAHSKCDRIEYDVSTVEA